MDGGAWWAAVHGVAKSRTQLSDFTFTFHFHALEKEMSTHSSVLAWRIPGMAEPGGLPSIGSHRVGHDWSDLAAALCLNQTSVRLLCYLQVADSGAHPLTSFSLSGVEHTPFPAFYFYFFSHYTCRVYFFIFLNFILFNFTILYWFCHISKWILHRYTCVPHPEPSSRLPPHTIPLGCPSAPAPSIQYRASNLDWRLVSYMTLYIFQCHSPKSSHPLPFPQSPKDCSRHQCLFCCLVYRVIVTIFLNSIYMC